MEEIWKKIDDRYSVSNIGRVKSNYANKERIMKQQKDYCGYPIVDLRNKDGKKHYFVHRLVAEAFIPNPDNLPQVNHKDENKENNCVENLEWCTNEYNLRYGTRKERAVAKTKIRIYSIDKNGNIEHFDGISDAGRIMSGKNCGKYAISNVLHERSKTAYGRQWFYEDII